MTDEEQNLYKQLKTFKDAYDKLYVIFEELDDLVKMGYDGPFMGEEVRGVFFAINEYKKWRSDEQKRKETIDS